MTDGSSDDDGSYDALLREAARVPKLAPADPNRAGTKLARYRIAEKLGQGGMGIVYRAEDVELSRDVALKVLPQTAMQDDERRRRFLREARAAAAVTHPNLAAVYDVGEAEGTVFLAMELVRGGSLRERIERGGLAVEEVLRIGVEVARGLAKAHAAGVVHRDLKPENVMLDGDGHVKIVDFGLAKPASASATTDELSTQEGRILGTPSYMAPEQAKGLRVDARADVFSVGVLLYELLTGVRPFAGKTTVDVLVAVARDTPPPPSARRRGVPRALDRVVSRCLAKDPADRFADAAALADALATCTVRAPTWRRGGLLLFVAAALALTAGALAVAARSPTATSSANAASPPTPLPAAASTPTATSTAATTPTATPASTSTSTSTNPPPIGSASSSRPSAPPATTGAAPAMPRTRSTAAPPASIDPLARQK